MKKSILILNSVFFALTFTANAQISTLKSVASSAAQSATSSTSTLVASEVKNALLSQLSSKLNLTAVQKTQVSSRLTTFLKAKEEIANLKKSDPTTYAKKLASLKSMLSSKMKSILNVAQYAKYTSLLSSANSSSVSSSILSALVK